MNYRSGVVPTGPLAPYASAFGAQLVSSGYSKSAAKKQRNLMVHLDTWLGEEGLDLPAMASDRVEEFFLARREAGRSSFLTRQSVLPLVSCLRSLGAIAASAPPPP